MDILMGEKEKKLVRMTIYLLRKKLGEQAKAHAIHDDMINCGNLGIRQITEILNKVSDKVTEDFQKDTIREISELGLWMCYKDTAYRDPFFYALDDILKHADEIRAKIKPYVKPPEKWQVNAWNESKKITKEERLKGNVTKGVSNAESIFVPGQQAKKLTAQLIRMKQKGEI